MKYIKFVLIVLAFLLIPSLAFASATDVNRLNNDHIEPLNAGDYFQAVHVDASSVTATSTLNGNLVVGDPNNGNNGFSFNSVNGALFAVTGAPGASFRGGAVGIGTSSPAFPVKLSVYGSATIGQCVDGIAPASNGLNVCGNTGIATTTGGYTLTVGGDINYTGNLYQNGILFSSGGGGNSAFTIGNGFIFNATSSDAVGIGSTTPSATLAVQGSSTQPTRDMFSVASSTGARSFQILANGRMGFFGVTPVVQQLGTADLGTAMSNLGLRAGGLYSLNSSSVILAGASSWSIEGKTGADSTQKMLATYEAGVKQALEGVLFTQSADGVVQNTVTETSILGTGVGTKTLPLNFFTVGKTVRIHVGGVYSTPIGTPSVTVKVKYGTTVLASKTTTSLLSSASGLEFNGDVLITNRSVGATGTVVVNGHVEYATGVGGQNATDPLDNGGLPVTIDTTASNALDVTLTWDSATATRIATSTVSMIEVIN